MNNLLGILLKMALCWYLFASSQAWANNQVDNVRIWPAADNTRLVFDMSAAPDFKYFMLENPDRLVIDLSQMKSGSRLPATNGESPLIKNIRSSTSQNTMRIVLDLSKTLKLRMLMVWGCEVREQAPNNRG